MSSSVPVRGLRWAHLRVLVALLGALLLVAGCASGGGTDAPTRLVTYERAWPDGQQESTVIWTDGRVEMRHHGGALERFAISAEDVDRIRDALKATITTDGPDASPVRTLTLGDGTVIERPRLEPGGVVELLDTFTTTHTL